MTIWNDTPNFLGRVPIVPLNLYDIAIDFYLGFSRKGLKIRKLLAKVLR
jgi:hypothetical protein